MPQYTPEVVSYKGWRVITDSWVPSTVLSIFPTLTLVLAPTLSDAGVSPFIDEESVPGYMGSDRGSL